MGSKVDSLAFVESSSGTVWAGVLGKKDLVIRELEVEAGPGLAGLHPAGRAREAQVAGEAAPQPPACRAAPALCRVNIVVVAVAGGWLPVLLQCCQARADCSDGWPGPPAGRTCWQAHSTPPAHPHCLQST